MNDEPSMEEILDTIREITGNKEGEQPDLPKILNLDWVQNPEFRIAIRKLIKNSGLPVLEVGEFASDFADECLIEKRQKRELKALLNRPISGGNRLTSSEITSLIKGLTDADDLIFLAEALIGENDLERLLALVNRISLMDLQFSQYDSLHFTCELYSDLERTALECRHKMEALASSSAEWRSVARHWKEAGDRPRAIWCLEKAEAIERDTFNPSIQVLAWLAESWTELGEEEKAQALMKEAEDQVFSSFIYLIRSLEMSWDMQGRRGEGDRIKAMRKKVELTVETKS